MSGKIIESSSNNVKRAALCVHYVRRCFIECPHCKKLCTCRLCHDENSDHKLDRHAVKHIKCSLCSVFQEVSERCQNCHIIFGKYFCKICTLFDDQDKGQYHCDGCGICRADGRENFFHCDKCGICLSKRLRDSHRCVERASRSDCPVCLEDLHSSTTALHVPACGHLIHRSCLDGMLKHQNYRCATCGKSVVDMRSVWRKLDEEVASTPMPAEYADSYAWILCRDCNEVSHVKFHVVGMKCSKCESYNTCSTKDPSETG